MKTKKCCICKKPIDTVGSWAHGHNAEPIKQGQCCSLCNATKVIPARIARIYAKPLEDK